MSSEDIIDELRGISPSERAELDGRVLAKQQTRNDLLDSVVNVASAYLSAGRVTVTFERLPTLIQILHRELKRVADNDAPIEKKELAKPR